MKAGELRELTAAELERKINDLRTELFNLRLRLATGDLENPMRVRLLRRDMARALTVLRAKEGRPQSGAPAGAPEGAGRAGRGEGG